MKQWNSWSVLILYQFSRKVTSTFQVATHLTFAIMERIIHHQLVSVLEHLINDCQFGFQQESYGNFPVESDCWNSQANDSAINSAPNFNEHDGSKSGPQALSCCKLVDPSYTSSVVNLIMDWWKDKGSSILGNHNHHQLMLNLLVV